VDHAEKRVSDKTQHYATDFNSAPEGEPVIPATWENCIAEFAFDGALIDLLVPGTGPSQWEVFWAALRGGPFELQAFRDGEPLQLPASAAWARAERQAASVMVSIVAGAITANCHFFGGDLELDIDPREIITESAFESVLAIMRFTAMAVQLPVFAVAEGGSPESAFLQVSPVGQGEYLPAGSTRDT
jgi:hypothetical protein